MPTSGLRWEPQPGCGWRLWRLVCTSCVSGLVSLGSMPLLLLDLLRRPPVRRGRPRASRFGLLGPRTTGGRRVT
eukprot:5046250-Prymnesium_polylepis.1